MLFLDPTAAAIQLLDNNIVQVQESSPKSFDRNSLDWWGNAYGFSATVIEVGVNKIAVEIVKGEDIKKDMIFNIASITKMFTAATLLRMTEEVQYQKYFPKGLDTPISNFLEALKKRYQESNYIQNDLEKELNFADITLRHLLQHTAGLGDLHWLKSTTNILKEYRNNPHKILEGELFESKQRVRGKTFGKYEYSNLGFELLGYIIAAIDNEESQTQQKQGSYGDMVRKLVIEPLALKNSFVADQMEFVKGKVRVTNYQKQQIAQANDYYNNKLHASTGFLYDYASGGIYSNPNDLVRFLAAFFGDGLFKDKDTADLRDSNPINLGDKDHPNNSYGIGYFNYYDKSGKFIAKGHEGSDLGFHSAALYNGKSAVAAIVVYENLTPPLAWAMVCRQYPDMVKQIKNKILTKEIIENLFYQKENYLIENYSQKQLLKMRQELDKDLDTNLDAEQFCEAVNQNKNN